MSRRNTPFALLLAALAACGGGGGPQDPDGPTQLLVVGIARQDFSPIQPLEGFFAFFFDIQREQLLFAEGRVNGLAFTDSLLPGTVPGPLYARPANVRPETAYRLTGTVLAPEGELAVTSGEVRAPDRFPFTIPATHPRNQPMTVTWGPIPDAQSVNVTAGSGFEVDVPASQGQFTIPASAFAGLPAGSRIEIEITAFNVFYISIAAGINGLQDAEQFALRFADVDNVDGGFGAFGGATTEGREVTLQ